MGLLADFGWGGGGGFGEFLGVVRGVLEWFGGFFWVVWGFSGVIQGLFGGFFEVICGFSRVLRWFGVCFGVFGVI